VNWHLHDRRGLEGAAETEKETLEELVQGQLENGRDTCAALQLIGLKTVTPPSLKANTQPISRTSTHGEIPTCNVLTFVVGEATSKTALNLEGEEDERIPREVVLWRNAVVVGTRKCSRAS
jgi:hypothetical protein